MAELVAGVSLTVWNSSTRCLLRRWLSPVHFATLGRNKENCQALAFFFFGRWRMGACRLVLMRCQCCVFTHARAKCPLLQQRTQRDLRSYLHWRIEKAEITDRSDLSLFICWYLFFLAAAAMVYLCRSTAGHCKAGIRRRLAMLPSCCIQTDCVVK